MGTYAEGTLNASDSQKKVAAFSDLAGMEDFLILSGESIDQEKLAPNSSDMFDFIPSLGVEVCKT